MTAFAPFQRVAIIGLGLLGGSVALAARQNGAAREVVAAGRRRAPLEAAREAGIVDAVGEIAEVVPGADLVVLASPVASMAGLLAQAAPYLAEGATVTDVGSVKASLAESLPGLLPAGVHYVGSHPMAGSHLRGPLHARGDLFEGACCVVTGLSRTPAAVGHRMVDFWRCLGARVVEREPVQHDDEVAWISHIPHLLAFAFVDALEKSPEGAAELAAGGFRDFTRIAQSGADLWADILAANGKGLAAPLQAFRTSLEALAEAAERGDREGLENLLSHASESLAASASRALSVEDAGKEKQPDPEV